jgi:alpha-L-fucosidase 2
MQITSSAAESVVSKHTAFFHDTPKVPQSDRVTDAPLLGNGDIGVSIGGHPDETTFYVCKNDFWVQAHVGETPEQRMERLLSHDGDRERRTGTRIIPLGHIDLQIPAMAGAKYLAEQDLYHAEVRGSYHVVNTSRSCFVTSWVCAVENLMVLEITAGDEPLPGVSVSPHAGEKGQYERFAYSDGTDGDAVWVKYAANYQNVPGRRIAAMAARGVDKEPRLGDGLYAKTITFDLAPNESVCVAVSILSDLDDPDCLRSAIHRAKTVTADTIAEQKKGHRDWWDGFWRQSLVEIGDRAIEQYYYGSQYILASSTREGKVVPGLYGNWVTIDRPRWTGSYTLNYNYESPFWALFTANHGDIARSYVDTLLDVIPIGRAYAQKKLSKRGVYLPVELGPWGTICSTLFHGQKSNALYATVNIILDFYYTWDAEFAKKAYPFLREVADFWEDYLVLEDDRYVVLDDALGEQYDGSVDKNPIITLALLRFFFNGMISISKATDMDSASLEQWQDILDRLSVYTTFEHGGKTVFRLTEEGTSWREHRGFAPFSPVYPCGEISLGSDNKMLEIAHNTFTEQDTWDDFNAFQSTYPTGVRVGYDPGEILAQLRRQIVTRGLPNLLIFHGGGGIEECNGIPACINEMMVQSHDFTIRVFPNWERGRDGYFLNLRTYGAFLVSSQICQDSIQFVHVESERGGCLDLKNPWPEIDITCYLNGIRTELPDLAAIDTNKGDTMLFIPADSSLEDALERIATLSS